MQLTPKDTTGLLLQQYRIKQCSSGLFTDQSCPSQVERLPLGAEMHIDVPCYADGVSVVNAVNIKPCVAAGAHPSWHAAMNLLSY